jgi:hypothetical protein
MRCTAGVLLVNRFFVAADLCCATIEESVYDTACVKQVMNGAEMAIAFRLRRRILQGRLEVGPLRGYE